MDPVGDPYAETAALDDHRRSDRAALEIEPDDLAGVHTPILLVVLRTATEDTEVLARIEEPLAGTYHLAKR